MGVCVDFRKLNTITEVDPESMTTAEELFRQLRGKQYLSIIDLTKGYWQIPVAPEHMHKTAFVSQVDSKNFYRCRSVWWIQELLSSEDSRRF